MHNSAVFCLKNRVIPSIQEVMVLLRTAPQSSDLLSPVPGECECGPESGVCPSGGVVRFGRGRFRWPLQMYKGTADKGALAGTGIPEHPQLRFFQYVQPGHLLFHMLRYKPVHQVSGGNIVHIPQRREDAAGSGDPEGPLHARQSFAAGHFTQTGFAGRPDRLLPVAGTRFHQPSECRHRCHRPRERDWPRKEPEPTAIPNVCRLPAQGNDQP